MKFNKLAKELDCSVADLAAKVAHILPNANGGTEVTDDQKQQITDFLTQPEPTAHALSTTNHDPILSILAERIESEVQLENQEPLVDEMISRYIADPADLPTDPDYRNAIVTYVELVKKRQQRKQQQSSKLRLLLRTHESAEATPRDRLEKFYSAEPNSTERSSTLNGNASAAQLSAASA